MIDLIDDSSSFSGADDCKGKEKTNFKNQIKGKGKSNDKVKAKFPMKTD